MDKINTEDLYDKYFREINPGGEHEKSFNVFTTAVRLGKIKDVKEVREYAKRYKAYVEEWNTTFQNADPVYISKENRLKSFGEFYASGMHKSTSFSKMDSRYMYLFGQEEFKIVKKKHDLFKEKNKSPW